MPRLVTNMHIVNALIKVGLVPPNCHSVEFSIETDGAFLLRYEVFVPIEDMSKLAEAFTIAAEEMKK